MYEAEISLKLGSRDPGTLPGQQLLKAIDRFVQHAYMRQVRVSHSSLFCTVFYDHARSVKDGSGEMLISVYQNFVLKSFLQHSKQETETQENKS